MKNLNLIKKYSSLLTLSFLLLGTLAVTSSASAQTDPKIQWKVLNTEHFKVIYDAKQQELAQIYAKHLENNLPSLSRYFTEHPDNTTIVINDRTDMTNGYATAIPYPMIMIFPVLPGSQDTISEYGDWSRELVMHEYTHILSFQPKRGLVKGLHYIFGNIITPNMILPRWYLEGIAVDMETRNSHHGRLRSRLQEASLRAYVYDKNLQMVELGEINETDLASWPYGARPYLFGSMMWSELIARYGEASIQELHYLYGGRFPFFIEGPMRDTTDNSYQGLFNLTQQTIETRGRDQIHELEKVPLLKGEDFKIKNANEIFSAQISPDGLKMAVVVREDDNKKYIRLLRRPDTQTAFTGQHLIDKVHLSTDGLRVAWSANSEQFMYERIHDLNRFHEVSDLKLHDLEKKRTQQISSNLRAREPHWLGNKVVYVKLAAGKTDLAISEISEHDGKYKTGNEKILFSGSLNTRISSPVFINQEEILFSVKDNSGDRLQIYNLTKQTTRPAPTVLAQNFNDAKMLSIHGQQLIFTSNHNGTSNLYSLPLSALTATSTASNSSNIQPTPLSHTATAMMQTTIDNSSQDYYSSELTSHGWFLRRFSNKQIRTLPPQLPVLRPMLADRYADKAVTTASATTDNEAPLKNAAITDYNALPYMWPHYWLPNISFYNGGSILGGSVAGSDPVGHHSYSFAGAYDSGPKELDYQFSYLNNQTEAILALQAQDIHTSIANTDIKFRQQDYLATATWQLSSWDTDLYTGIGYHSILRDFSTAIPGHAKAKGPRAHLYYQDLSKSGDQISPESGAVYTLAATHFDSGSGSNLDEPYQKLEMSTQNYISGGFLPKHHVISIHTQGQMIQQRVSLADGAITIPYQLFNNLPSPIMVMRGYLPGQFLGKTALNTNLEYRFPLWKLEKGAGTTPIFMRRIHGAIVADGIALDGYAYNHKLDLYERLANNQSYWSTGAELKFDTTLGFAFPVTFYAGYYLPLTRYTDAQQWVIGMQL